MASPAEPLIAAGAFLVIGIASLFAMRRHRAFVGVLALGALAYVFAVVDHHWNDSAAEAGTYLAFTVLAILFVVLAVLTFLSGRPDGRPARRATPQPGPPGPGPSAAATPTAVRRAKAPASPYYDYKGDVHKVIDVEGIGPVYAEKMQAIGIETTARLCYEDPARLARRLDVPRKTVASWQHMAELAKVDGIGKQYAEALARSGVQGIEALKRRDPDGIATAVNEYLSGLDVNVLGQPVTPKRIRSWQTKAKPMRRVRQKVPEA